MRIPSPASKRKARIEIIPLIDIIFFLLATFVMLSLSMVKNQGIAVALPGAATHDAAASPTHTTVSVTANGDVYYNKDRVSLELLPARLRELKRLDPNPVVYLNGDESAQFGRSIAVLDVLRQEGITQVSIRTRPPGSR